jgi:hypothetical protein
MVYDGFSAAGLRRAIDSSWYPSPQGGARLRRREGGIESAQWALDAMLKQKPVACRHDKQSNAQPGIFAPAGPQKSA